jgi:hypothetical protein
LCVVDVCLPANRAFLQLCTHQCKGLTIALNAAGCNKVADAINAKPAGDQQCL